MLGKARGERPAWQGTKWTVEGTELTYFKIGLKQGSEIVWSAKLANSNELWRVICEKAPSATARN